MIPILYTSTETNFEHNGLGVLKDTKSSIVIEKRNGLYELELTYPVGSFLYDEIKKNYIIKAKANDRYDNQLFRIYNILKPLNGLITVKAQHITYDNVNNFIESLDYTGNCIGALQLLKSSGDHECRFNFNSDIAMSAKYNVKRKNLLESIAGSEGSIVDTYGNGADIVRDNFNISILNNAGVNKNVLIAYRKNLTGFICNEDTSNLVTRIYPYAVKDDVLITLSEKFIDSELLNAYYEPYTRGVDYSNDESVIDETTLRIKASTYFKKTKNDIPKLNYDIEFVVLGETINYKVNGLREDIGLFDTVIVRHDIYGIDTEVKIIETQYDTLKEKYIKIISGQPKTNLRNVITDVIDDSINEVTKDKVTVGFLDDAIKTLSDAITGNDGGYVRLNPPNNPSELLILDNEDINLANIVWRFNKEGFGVSLNGYNGSFLGLTKNGKLVINEATANKITALLIEGGMLKSINELTWINMDDGTFNFANKLKFDGVNWDIDLTGKDLATNTDVQTLINVNSNSILAQVSNSNKLISKNTIVNGDFTSSTGSSSYQNWNKNTIGAIASTYSVDGTNWCNFYTSTLAGELFAYQDITIDVGKTYEFYCKVAKYASTKQYYCIRIQEYISDVWTTKKEFTGTVDVDRSNPLVLYTKYKPTVNQVRIWIGKTDGNKFDIYATDFQMFYTADVVKSSELKILSDKIESKVSSSDVGTIVEQNAYAVKIAWNKISNYVQFENGGLSIYNGSLTESQKRAVFNERGSHFWRDGYYLGKIGTNQYVNDNSIKGIVFDLEPDGGYMSWSVMKNASDVSYTMMWTYANKTVGGYTAGQLHAGCDIDMHNYYFRNYNFEGGGISGTLVFSQIVEMASNGTAARWFNNSKLVFKKGVLIDASWGNV